jgi:hypothetical protein
VENTPHLDPGDIRPPQVILAFHRVEGQHDGLYGDSPNIMSSMEVRKDLGGRSKAGREM